MDIDGSHAAARTYPDDETKDKTQQLKADVVGFEKKNATLEEEKTTLWPDTNCK